MVGMSCKAQTIYSLYDGDRNIQGAYYKDLDNDLNNFVGTWEYINGTTSLTITLLKKEMQPFTSGDVNFYEDIIVGEYQYIENGMVKINTLPELLIPKDPYEYNITGNGLIGPEINMQLFTQFTDPHRDIAGMEAAMYFQHVDENGIEKLSVKFIMTAAYDLVNGQSPQYINYTLPFGEYLLVKQ